MSDNIIARHTQINAGAISSSPEELAQKHQSLFQEYSRLKAQHTVLKKAVKKERTENASLQKNVKDKEKELRKLQGQLDILAFHNERLSKRIEAVQNIDTKGSHFSLLGGAIKKELEKSNQALDAANVDLAKKIDENEKLHADLSEIDHVYTNHLSGLYEQISTLEKRIEELQDERALLQSESSNQSSTLVKEKTDLENEIHRIKEELSSKNRLVDEYQQQNKQVDNTQPQVETDLTITKLREELANQSLSAEQQIKKLEKEIHDLEDTITQIKSDHVEQLKAAEEKSSKLEIEITNLESTVAQLQSQQSGHSSTSQRIETLEKDISELQQTNTLLQKANDSLEFERTTLVKDSTSLRMETTGTIDGLKDEVQQKKNSLELMEEKITLLECQLEEQQQQLSNLQSQVVSYEGTIKAKEADDAKMKGYQYQENSGNNEDDEDEDEDDDAPFVYPVPSEESNATTTATTTTDTKTQDNGPEKQNTKTNTDTIATNSTNGLQATSVKSEPTNAGSQIITDQNKDDRNDDDGKGSPPDELEIEARIQEREKKLKQYYECQMNQLMEKLESADSKASRFVSLVDSLKEKLAKGNEEKKALQIEVQTLKDDVVKAKESLTTTESKYQEQLDVLTEYITQLQQPQKQSPGT